MDGQKVPVNLVVWNQGKYPLTGLTFMVINPNSAGPNGYMTDVQLLDGPPVVRTK